ncbi:hypothetical protein Vadar_006497 [Vaccinium darrowii]|uniref:Uncharacterized protein n=1 Tax=Vaccinium darrowii TaxID=229202 RepID=A0ACB7ZIT2_9ERIC|nr:hypothetical protein Vadar_006497 [Vaccinium darrowii]
MLTRTFTRIDIYGRESSRILLLGRVALTGQTVLFNFVTNAHDVLQETKDSYDACTSTNPIGSSITTSPANITLTSAGEHYYICTYGRHCQSGQKLTITVSASSTPTATSPPSTTNPPPPSTPSPTSSPTPEVCAPEPSTTTPPANGPSPPIMESSSPAVFAGVFLTILNIAVATLFF